MHGLNGWMVRITANKSFGSHQRSFIKSYVTMWLLLCSVLVWLETPLLILFIDISVSIYRYFWYLLYIDISVIIYRYFWYSLFIDISDI